MEKDLLEKLIRLSDEIARLGRAMGQSTGVTLAQWRVLETVRARPGVSLRELARLVGLTPGSATVMVRALSRRKLLFREPHSHDSRRKEHFLSRTGFEALTQVDRWLARSKLRTDRVRIPEVSRS